MRRKSLSTLLFVAVFTLRIYSQAPDAFQYQAIVSNEGGVLTDADVTVRITIRENTAIGTTVYSETHAATTNSFGMVSLQIGKGTENGNAFSSINWSKGVFFIETEIEKGGGFVQTGTQQLMSVPYAKYADTAGKIEMSSASGKKFALTIDDNGNISAEEINE